MTQIQSQLGLFSSTFSLIESVGIEIIKVLLDALTLLIGSASGYFWNMVAGAIIKNSNLKGFDKDVFNAAVAFVINVNKDVLKAASDSLGQQNSLSAAMGIFMKYWQQSQADFNKFIFSGSVQSLPKLGKMVQGGALNWPAGVGPDFQGYVNEVEKLLTAHLIPAAWQTGKTVRHPIVLESTDPCTSQAGKQVKGWMSDDTAAATHMCMNDKIYYLVDAKAEPTVDARCTGHTACDAVKVSFDTLPGGTFANLSGGRWSGVTVNDIVIASYEGWKANGNKNGWSAPDFQDASSRRCQSILSVRRWRADARVQHHSPSAPPTNSTR